MSQSITDYDAFTNHKKNSLHDTILTVKFCCPSGATPLNNILHVDPETNMETHSNEGVEGPLDYPTADEEFGKQISRYR